MSTIVVSGSTPAEVSVTIPQVNNISVTPPDVQSVSVSVVAAPGAPGQGLVSGGSENQFIQKNSATDYDTKWSAYTLPAADGEDGQVLTTNGAATVTFAYPKTIAEDVKNVSGGTLVKGTPVHVTGSVGNLAEVIAADAATNYPAHFVLNQDLDDEEEGLGIAIGFINNVDVPDASIYTEGQTVYLGASGGWTTTKPTGTNAIQNLGIIIKVNVTGGGPAGKISGIIMGAGRANDVPNIATGNIWAGNADGVATATDTAYIDIANSRVGIGTTTPSDKLHVSDYQPSSIVWAKIENTSLVGAAGAGVSYKTPNRTWQTVGRETGYSIENTTAGSTPFNISSSGNVGVGTTSPNYLLDVESVGAGARVYNTAGSTSVYLTTPAAQNASLYFGPSTDNDEGGITYRTASSSMAFTTNTSEAMRIDSSGNVGIGTISPLGKLHVKNSAVRLSANSGSDNIVIEENGYSGITILSNSANAGQIHFGDQDAENVGMIQYFHSDNSMRFATGNASEKLRIDSSGNVGIGTTTPAYALDIKKDTTSILNLYRPNSSTAAASVLDFSFNTANATESVYARIRADVETNTDLAQGGDLSFHTANNGTVSEKLRITQEGNVGIGTTSPGNTLHVLGDNNTTPVRFAIGSNANYYFQANSTSGYATTFNMDNTGLYIGHNSSGRSLNLQTNSTDRITILGGGNVGIGTTSPASKLHLSTNDSVAARIIGANSSYTSFFIGNTATGAATLYLDGSNGDLSGSDYAAIRQNNDLTLELHTEPLAGDLIMTPGGTERMRVKKDGKVGIGTTNPQALLQIGAGGSENTLFHSYDVYNEVKFYGTLDQTGNGVWEFINDGTWDQTRFYVEDANNVESRLTFRFTGNRGSNEILAGTSTGNVGIGTTSPSAKLDVVGLANINDGSNNVMISSRNTAMAASSGSNNTAVGDVAGFTNASGNNNSFFGRATGYYSTGYNNVLLGMEAGYGGATSTFSNTVAVGYQALYDLTTGAQNTAVGYRALTNITTQNDNTAVGYQAGYANASGGANSFFGTYAGYSNTGSSNTAVGYAANFNNSTGSNNVAIGRSAALGASGASTFSNTVAVGYQALQDLTTGANNTAVGYQAATNITAGNYNTALGYQAGYTNSTGSRNIFLGYQAGYYETGSDKLYINNSSGSNPLIYGDFNLRTATINGDLNVSSGNLRADAVEINGRALAATPAAGEYGAGSKIVTQFASGTVTAGKVYVANAGSWAEGDANAGSTSIGMIAVATDSASATEMLIEGVVKLSSNTGFSGAAEGTVLYLSTTAGELTTVAPSTAGEYVRVCGYVVNESTNEVFFSPSRDWTAL